jgi:hypothetical protein
MIVSCDAVRNKLPPLAETFSQRDKHPFGAYVVHRQLQQLYYHNTIRTKKENFENISWELADTGSIYISISKNLFLSQADLERMLAYVNDGNSIFISSNNIDEKLLDTLGCGVNKYYKGQFYHEMEYTSVNLEPTIFTDSSAYHYFYIPFFNHFSKVDSLHSKMLGNNKAGANYAVIFYGKGRFYLHTEPRAFSNYFLLKRYIGMIITTKKITREMNPAEKQALPYCFNTLKWPGLFGCLSCSWDCIYCLVAGADSVL